jgi:hypothetical protein
MPDQIADFPPPARSAVGLRRDVAERGSPRSSRSLWPGGYRHSLRDSPLHGRRFWRRRSHCSPASAPEELDTQDEVWESEFVAGRNPGARRTSDRRHFATINSDARDAETRSLANSTHRSKRRVTSKLMRQFQSTSFALSLRSFARGLSSSESLPSG